MNKNYRSIWSSSKKTWIAVSELTQSKGKKNKVVVSKNSFFGKATLSILVGVLTCISIPSWAVDCYHNFDELKPFVLTNSTDVFTCAQGEFSDLNGQGGNDYLDLNNQLGDISINGDILFGNGEDNLIIKKDNIDFQFNISGINSINMGDGNDLLIIENNTNSNVNMSSNINLGGGDDTFNLTFDGDVNLTGDINGGEGNNTINIMSNLLDSIITINGNLVTENGDDRVFLNNTLMNGSISLGDGTNSLSIYNSTINAEINSGNGNDNINLTDSIINSSILTSTGNDAINLNNSKYGDIFTGDNNDSINITGFHSYSNNSVIDGGNGEDDVSIESELPITLNATNLKNFEYLYISNNTSITFSGKSIQFSDGDANIYQNFYLQSGSTLSFTEDKFEINFKNNNGVFINDFSTVNLRGSKVGRTLAINGDYDGLYKSKILLNTQLGNDSSKSDQLIINGHSDGKTSVFINNKGGAGGKTVNGIRLIIVKGDSNAIFNLGAAVQAGGYEYFLVKRNKDWYLVSESNSVNPDNTNTDPLNPSDSNKKPNSPQNKIYRPAVAGYLQASQAQFDQNTSLIGDAYQRQNANTKVDGNWARAVTDKSSLKTNTFGYAQTQQVFQFGKDLFSQTTEVGGQKHINLAGATFAVGQQTADYTDKQRGFTQSGYFTGSSDSKIYGLGGYYYIQGQNNQYLDIQGQVIASNTSFSDVNQVSARQKGLGVATSIEMGQNNAYSLAGLDITPQAQVIYQNIKNHGFKDLISDVSKQTAESLRLRLGVQIKSLQKVNSDQTSGLSWNATVNLWQDIFDAPTRTVAGTLAETHSSNNTWAEMGFGFKHKISDSSEWGANLSHHQSLNNNKKTGNSVHLTYRMKW